MEYVAILESCPLITQDIWEATKSGSELQEITQKLLKGQKIRQGPYAQLGDKLTVNDDILFYDSRPVIPETLRGRVMDILHAGHSGIVQMKNRAKESMHWPGINKQCERTVKQCEDCQQRKTTANKQKFTI